MSNLEHVTVISTNNKTAVYLIRKKELEQSIGWYSTTIIAIDKQQEDRRNHLQLLQEELFKLEKEYYGT